VREYDVPTDDQGNLTLAGLLHLYTSGKPAQLAEDIWALGLGRYKGGLCYSVQGSLYSLATCNGESESLIVQRFASFADAFALAQEHIDLTTMPGVIATQLRSLSRICQVMSLASAHLDNLPPFARKLKALTVLAKALRAKPFAYGPFTRPSVTVCTRDGRLMSCQLENLQGLF
jgi:hypothetical protein